jgi:pyruvate/2-oxoglutarate dehydrogenase complex dihydrolipoamide dehydrogenase (E3) component
VSHAIFSSLQVAGVGLREQDLKNMRINYYKSCGTIDSISGTIHIHPALSEVVFKSSWSVRFLSFNRILILYPILLSNGELL